MSRGLHIRATFDFPVPAWRDGVELHRRVPPTRWSVTAVDLSQLRKVVRCCVAKGKIVPTDRDNFSTSDSRTGPCIHTVVHQLIKPITDQAGKMSWALMVHPDGLDCDLFVTHCWAEGVYEFIDKVLHSWPRGARHAYCCMLSNPQSLDISGLIRSPRDSPFAKALAASTCMLVVPNHHGSIYCRVWCTYEAYIAYSESKDIFTSCAPVPGVMVSISAVLLIGIVGFFVGFIYTSFNRNSLSERGQGPRSMNWVATLTLLLAGLIPPGLAPRILICIAGCSSGIAGGLLFARGFPGFHFSFGKDEATILRSFGLLVIAALSEGDRLRRLQILKEAAQLRKGYTGRIRDAESSVQTDKTAILEELARSDVEKQVEDSISVLLDAGMSTQTLRIASARGVGRLREAGHVNASLVMLAWISWIRVDGLVINAMSTHRRHLEFGSCDRLASFPELCARLEADGHVDFAEGPDWFWAEWCRKGLACANYWCSPAYEKPENVLLLVMTLQLVLWVVVPFAIRKDRRGFAASTFVRIAAVTIFCKESLLYGVQQTWEHGDWCSWYSRPSMLVYLIGTTVFAIPICILFAILGPGLVSKLPVAGPWIVWLLMVRPHGRPRCKWMTAWGGGVTSRVVPEPSRLDVIPAAQGIGTPSWRQAAEADSKGLPAAGNYPG